MSAGDERGGVSVIERVAVIGSGTMGRQISLQIARHGLPVALFDTDLEQLERAREAQRGYVDEWVASGQLAGEDRETVLGRVRLVTDLGEAVHEVDLAIEVVPERVELKRQVFGQLDEHCREGAIIATNSSSIRVSLLEDATGRPERVANLHFYLPVWELPMVEVGGGTRTEPAVLDALTDFAGRIGLYPLRVRKESTGFIMNRIWRAIKKESLKVADAGVASVEDIDRAWMLFWGVPLGPFGKMDDVGLDVIQMIEEHYARESGDPADLPPPILTERVARGELGRKTGRGFYTYPNPAYQAPGFLDPPGGEGGVGRGGAE